ncbi:MAG: low molecular weight protein-tyrosine-phosphatase [Acidimicrobiia bacterium]
MPYRILNICLGNICRSPGAEAVIRSKANAAGLDIEVDSAGTSTYHLDEPPHLQSIQAGARRGYTVAGRGRQLQQADFRTFDLIVTMDDANLENVRQSAPSDATSIIAPLMEFAGGGQVPDPWGKPDSAYDHMYDLIEEAVDGLIAALADQSSGLRQNKTN